MLRRSAPSSIMWVAQQVTGPFLADACGLHRPDHPVAQAMGVETFAVAGEEKGCLRDAHAECGAAGFEIGFQPAQGTAADRQQAAFAAFAFAHVDAKGLERVRSLSL